MANITLSIPEDLYRLMKRYKSINWSEIARRAIVREVLYRKARDEGLTLRELDMLLDVSGIPLTGERPTVGEGELQDRLMRRERRRMEGLREGVPS